MNYIIYNKTTGIISRAYTILDSTMPSEVFYAMIEQQLSPDEGYLDDPGIDVIEYYVDIETSQLVHRGKPPGNFHMWDSKTKEWVFNQQWYEESLIP